jgi:DNA-binding XRE family transcriptional regulator
MSIVTQHLEIDGKRYVLLPEAAYETLCGRAGEAIALDESDLPPLPKPDRKGRFPAEEYARVSLARDIIRSRREARLTQTELARRSGIRQETLSRIESGKSKASVRTVEKIQKALARQRNRSGR